MGQRYLRSFYVVIIIAIPFQVTLLLCSIKRTVCLSIRSLVCPTERLHQSTGYALTQILLFSRLVTLTDSTDSSDSKRLVSEGY